MTAEIVTLLIFAITLAAVVAAIFCAFAQITREERPWIF